MDIKKAKTIYMIGIKGVGMTMLAQFLTSQGKLISGSDVEAAFMTDQVLKKCGLKIKPGFSPANIDGKADLIVYSSAYNAKNNPELAAALQGRKPVISYAEALGQVLSGQYGIAVAGSHGKTTTTAWLGFVLDRAGLGPSVMTGAYVGQFGGTSLTGRSDYLVIEADEYQNKLKYYNPQAVVLNNIDYDHPDFFPDEKSYTQVFVDFISRLPKKGFLIANFDDPIIRKIAYVNCRAKVITYAIDESADYVAHNIKHENTKQYFKVKLGLGDSAESDPGGSDLGDFAISLMGRHNIYNALAVIAAAIELNIDLSLIRRYLEDFEGTARRLERLGEFRGAVIVDDYAHHPTEVGSTLKAVRQKYQGKNIITVFHPHTFTRTRALLDDFAESLGNTDELIVLDIYGSAREKQGGVHSQDLVNKIKNNKTKIKSLKYIPTLEECEEYLRENIGNNDVVLLMGAGDVFRIGEKLLK